MSANAMFVLLGLSVFDRAKNYALAKTRFTFDLFSNRYAST